VNLTSDQPSFPYTDDDPAGEIAVAGESDRVMRATAKVDGRLPALDRVESAEDIAQLGGALELQLVRGLPHPSCHGSPHTTRPATENLEDLVDHVTVFGFGLKTGAGCLAAPDMVVETRSRRELGRHTVMARSDRVHPLDRA
jgi:hypothetical protein